MSEASECREVDATPLKDATSRKLRAQTPMPTSTIGCSIGNTILTNCRDPKARPTRPATNTTVMAEEGKIHRKENSEVGLGVGEEKIKTP